MTTRALRTPESAAGSPRTAHVEDDVRRAQQGDVDAFERIYRATAPAVYALCRRMLSDEREARELTQDVFVRSWERLAQFRGQSALHTWIHRLAVNVVLEHLRKTKRDAARLINTDDDDFGAAREEPSVDSRMDLTAALERLAPGARAVLVLHDIEGYSHDEIAQMTGIAPGTARAQLWRARRSLSKLLRL